MDGGFPKELKLSMIKPLFEKNGKHKVENYRLIGVNSSTSNILEHVILHRALPLWKRCSAMATNQFSYEKDPSRIGAITRAYNVVQNSLSLNKVAHAVFSDLRKALYWVDPSVLSSISPYGIRGISYGFIKTYLKYRQEKEQITNESENVFQQASSENKNSCIILVFCRPPFLAHGRWEAHPQIWWYLFRGTGGTISKAAAITYRILVPLGRFPPQLRDHPPPHLIPDGEKVLSCRYSKNIVMTNRKHHHLCWSLLPLCGRFPMLTI